MDNTVALIMCAGDAERWMSWPLKQFVSIDGEKLIYRTHRQLEELMVKHFVVTHMFSYYIDIKTITPKHRRTLCQSILSTQAYWLANTKILLGDVMYSDETIADIIMCQDPVKFFGSAREVYGLSFMNRARVLMALQSVTLSKNRSVSRGKLWNLYYHLSGLPHHIHTEPANSDIYELVTDYTRDFDTREDYLKFVKEKT